MRSVDFGLRAVITALAVGIMAIAAQPAVAEVTGVIILDLNADGTAGDQLDVDVEFEWTADSQAEAFDADIIISFQGEEIAHNSFSYENPVPVGTSGSGDSIYFAIENVSDFLEPGTPELGPGDCLVVRVVVEDVDDESQAENEATVCIDDSMTEDPTGVPVDIKPSSCPNPITTTQRGVIPVAIAGTDDLDVRDIDPASVRLMDVEPIRFSYEDVATPYFPNVDAPDCIDCTEEGGDGIEDLTLKFDAQELVEAIRGIYGDADGELVDRDCLILFLDGELCDGTPIAGEDVVRIQSGGPGAKSGKNDTKKDKSDKDKSKKDKSDKDKSDKGNAGKGKPGKGNSGKGKGKKR